MSTETAHLEAQTLLMDSRSMDEGIRYAETNLFSGKESHLYLDKKIIKSRFDLHGKQVMDFGCGMGSTALWLAAEMGAHVDGFDLDPNHITVAEALRRKHRVEGVSFEVRNIVTSPVEKQYDFVVLNDVVEHLREDWIPSIFNILVNKNLKPGGIIFISYPPWEGPHASHLQRVIPIPWVQFLPQRYVRSLARKNNQNLVGKKDLLTEYLELNHMTHRKLMSYLRPYSLEKVFRISHTKLNDLPLLRNASLHFFPLNYIITKELIAFRKPAVQ